MPERSLNIERRFRTLVREAGLPEPDEAAHLRRAVIFLWYESKAFVLVDLDELPSDADPFDGLSLEGLAADVCGAPPMPGTGDGPGFARTG